MSRKHGASRRRQQDRRDRDKGRTQQVMPAPPDKREDGLPPVQVTSPSRPYVDEWQWRAD